MQLASLSSSRVKMRLWQVWGLLRRPLRGPSLVPFNFGFAQSIENVRNIKKYILSVRHLEDAYCWYSSHKP